MASPVVNHVTLPSLVIVALSLVTASAAPAPAPTLGPAPSHTHREDRAPLTKTSPTQVSSAIRGSALGHAPRVEHSPTTAPRGSAPAPLGSAPREDRAPLTKTFDQRQQGTTNIQAHLDNIVVILVPSNRISITDFAAKTEPELMAGKPGNKLFQSLSELKSAQTSIEAQPEFFNSIPESKAKPEGEKKQAEGSIPEAGKAVEKGESREKGEGKPVQMDGAAKKFPFQLETRPDEIPVFVIQDP